MPAVILGILMVLLRYLTGAIGFVLIYDLLINRMLPLTDYVKTKLFSDVAGAAGAGSGQFAEILTFFDITRAITVLISAMVVAIVWKIALAAAKSVTARMS